MVLPLGIERGILRIQLRGILSDEAAARKMINPRA